MQTDLQRTRIGCRFACDLAELARGRIQIRTRPVGVVDEVVGVRSELHVGGFCNGELLLQRQVPVLVARLLD